MSRIEIPKFDSVEPGFCRVYYRQGKRLLCFQENFPGEFALYRCSADGEPSHSINADKFIKYVTEPKVRTRFTRKFWDFITKQRQTIH